MKNGKWKPKKKKENQNWKSRIKNRKLKIKNKKGNSVDIRILCSLLRTNIYDIRIHSFWTTNIFDIDLIRKSRPGDNCHGWLASIPWMVTHHPKDKDGHPASPGWSPISLRLVTHYPIAPSQILSPSFPRMVTYDPKHGH